MGLSQNIFRSSHKESFGNFFSKKNHQFELLIMNTEGIDILKQQRNQRPMTCHQTVVVVSNYFVNMSIC